MWPRSDPQACCRPQRPCASTSRHTPGFVKRLIRGAAPMPILKQRPGHRGRIIFREIQPTERCLRTPEPWNFPARCAEYSGSGAADTARAWFSRDSRVTGPVAPTRRWTRVALGRCGQASADRAWVARRRAGGTAWRSSRAQRFARFTRALSVAMPVFAYICRYSFEISTNASARRSVSHASRALPDTRQAVEAVPHGLCPRRISSPTSPDAARRPWAAAPAG